MGLFDFVDDLKWKVSSAVDNIETTFDTIKHGVSEIASEIADGTVKEGLVSGLKDTKKDFDELSGAAKEEFKKSPAKATATALALLAAPVLATGVAGAAAATAAIAVMAGGAAKTIEEIKNDEKLERETKKVYEATRAEYERKLNEALKPMRDFVEQYKDLTSAQIATYIIVHGMFSNGEKVLNDEECNYARGIAAGLHPKAMSPATEREIGAYRERTLSMEQAREEAMKFMQDEDCIDRLIYNLTNEVESDASQN